MPSPAEIRAERARRSLASWCGYADPSYVVAEPHRKLIAALEAVERGDIRRLIVSMPPRHGKSLTSTIRFPSWYLGRKPDNRVILAAHTASLAYSFSRRARNEFTEYGGPVFGCVVADDSSAVDHWDIADRRGGLVAAGVGGPITGQGADLLVIDDPVKDAEAAASETQRRTVVDWWQQVARTRLHPRASAVLVMTRWHEADLAGFLLDEMKKGGEAWDELRLPMLDGAGAVLWPERYPMEEVQAIRVSVGTRNFEALYQQRPTALEGSIFKREWWKRYRETPPVFEQVVQSWDLSFKDLQSSDWVVGQVWGRAGAKRYLLHQIRERMGFSRTCQAMRGMAERYKETGAVLVEDKANGPAVIDTLRGEIPGLLAVEPQGSKEARAYAVEPQVEAGNVYIPENGRSTWEGPADKGDPVAAFVEECAAFPNGVNDDQVDAMTQALNWMRGRRGHITTPSVGAEKSRAVTR